MKAFFVLRHHNDFDSVAPVIHGWVSQSTNHVAIVYFASAAVKWRGDYRTQMLCETGRVEFCDMWSVVERNGGVLARLWQRNRADGRFVRKVLQISTEAQVVPGFAISMRRFLDRHDPSILAFDYYEVPKRRRLLDFFGYQEVLAWAKKHKKPLVALPHGLLLYFAAGMKPTRLATPYDAIFVESDCRVHLLDCKKKDVVVSGSPRYDPQWVMKIADRLGEGDDWPSADRDKTRVVFFATTAKDYFEFGKLLDWLSLLARHPDVELVVQPHPRGQKEREFAPIAHLSNVRIDSQSPASRLITGADLVSTLVSSVVAEAAVREKEILFPKFLTDADVQFDAAGACIALSEPRETMDAIDEFRSGTRIPRSNYRKFLKRHVYGNKDSNTIARIVGKMQDLAQSRH